MAHSLGGELALRDLEALIAEVPVRSTSAMAVDFVDIDQLCVRSEVFRLLNEAVAT